MSSQGTAPSLMDIRQTLRTVLPPGCHAVLFGSHATGTAHPTSDWDVGLIGEQEIPGDVIARVRDALEELPTLHRFDIVDLNTVPDGFRQQALRDAISLL